MRRTSGISLMVLIFLSLCLMTFGLLSLSESTADKNLSQKSADRTTQYYAASNTASQILAQIDEQLAKLLKNTQNSTDPAGAYLKACEELPELCTQAADTLSAASTQTVSELSFDLTWTTDSSSLSPSSGTLSFQVPVTETQILEVALLIRYPQNDTDYLYELSKWKITNTRDWNPDTTQKLPTF